MLAEPHINVSFEPKVIWFLTDPITKSSCRFYIRNLFGLFSARNQIVIGTNANALQRQL